MTLDHLASVVRLAKRTFSRRPWSSLAMVGTLAIGIGATTATYALFNFVLFRPIPGVADEQTRFIAQFKMRDQKAGGYGAVAALPALRAAGAGVGVERLGAADVGTVAVATPGGPPTFEQGEFVTAQYFSVIGARARLGSILTDEQAESSINMVAISERLWRSKFGGAPTAVGQPLLMNGHSFQVVGVIERFRGLAMTRIGAKDWWAPLQTMRVLEGPGPSSVNTLVGMVREGSSLPGVEQQLQATYSDFAKTLNARDATFTPFVSAGLQSPGADAVRTLGMRMYWLLFAAAGALLVIACVNAATMLLQRSAERERETAIRLAIGANRRHIFGQFLIESVAHAAVAGALGVGVAWAITQLFRGMRLFSYFPPLETIDLDVRVLAFATGMALVTVVGFGLLPGVMASRADIRGALGQSRRIVSRAVGLRQAFVVSEIALSLMLVAGALVLNRSLQNLLTTDLGMHTEGVYKLSLRPHDLGYDTGKSTEILRATFTGLQAAGFAVATSSPEPLAGGDERVQLQLGDRPAVTRNVFVCSVSPSYFGILGMHFVDGRGFADTAATTPQADMSVVISASLAADLFGQEPAQGRTFLLTRGAPSRAVVIGVVADTRASGVRGGQRLALYHTRPSGYRNTHILVRPNGPIGPSLDRVREVVRGVEPNLPITTLRPLATDVTDELSQDRVLARLSGLVAVLAAVLGAIGVFSVVGQLVAGRRREFGIHAALGASRIRIFGHVLTSVVLQTVLGVAIGFSLYWWSSRFVADRLYGIEPLDPVTMLASVGALVALTGLAATLPAARAASVHPAVALRTD